MTEHHSSLALTYARSLLELADDRGEIESVSNDMDAIEQVLEENPKFVEFLRDPGISQEERSTLIRNVFGGKINVLVERVLLIMSERGRLAHLSEVTAAFEHLLDEKLGKVEADVTVAMKLDDNELEQVRQRVSTALGKDAVIHQYVDESIIGGMILRVGDQIIDASVRRQLQAMKERLLKG